jgi:hypothetical protein
MRALRGSAAVVCIISFTDIAGRVVAKTLARPRKLRVRDDGGSSLKRAPFIEIDLIAFSEGGLDTPVPFVK